MYRVCLYGFGCEGVCVGGNYCLGVLSRYDEVGLENWRADEGREC